MFKTALLILSTSYVAWYMEQHELMAVYPFDETYATPEAAGLPHLNEAVFDADDGTKLILWRGEAKPGRPTVLYFSGNAGTLKDRAPRFRKLTDQGFGVVAPAYRGSSGSSGKPEEALLMSDAHAIAASLDSTTLVLYGESLGAAVAVQLAAEGVGTALVLEAPFTSFPDLVSVQYPAESLDHLITQRWDSLQVVSAVVQPLLVIHGEDDRVVPIEMGQQMFDAAGSARKELLTVDAHGHHALWTAEVQTTLFAFFDGFQN